jgi:hypothetical protein
MWLCDVSERSSITTSETQEAVSQQVKHKATLKEATTSLNHKQQRSNHKATLKEAVSQQVKHKKAASENVEFTI